MGFQSPSQGSKSKSRGNLAQSATLSFFTLRKGEKFVYILKIKIEQCNTHFVTRPCCTEVQQMGCGKGGSSETGGENGEG